MKRFIVEVRQTIEVTIDETKLDEAFMTEFRESFYPFTTLGQHACHLAQLHARGVIDWVTAGSPFVEGYGKLADFGVTLRKLDGDEDVEEADVVPPKPVDNPGGPRSGRRR